MRKLAYGALAGGLAAMILFRAPPPSLSKVTQDFFSLADASHHTSICAVHVAHGLAAFHDCP